MGAEQSTNSCILANNQLVNPNELNASQELKVYIRIKKLPKINNLCDIKYTYQYIDIQTTKKRFHRNAKKLDFLIGGCQSYF